MPLLKLHLPNLIALLPLFSVIVSVSVLIRQRCYSAALDHRGLPTVRKQDTRPQSLALYPMQCPLEAWGSVKPPAAAAGQGARMQERKYMSRLLLPLGGVGCTWSQCITQEAGRLEAAAGNFSSQFQHSMDCSLSPLIPSGGLLPLPSAEGMALPLPTPVIFFGGLHHRSRQTLNKSSTKPIILPQTLSNTCPGSR